MALTKFIIPPEQAGYVSTDGQESLSVMLDGGLSRFRRDIIGASFKVNVNWLLDEAGYFYARAFYRSVSKKGSIPFLIDLLIDTPTLIEHEAYFVINTFKLSSNQGSGYRVSAQMEVKPVAHVEADDIAYVDLYNANSGDPSAVLAQLETLSNVDLPNAIPV